MADLDVYILFVQRDYNEESFKGVFSTYTKAKEYAQKNHPKGAWWIENCSIDELILYNN